MKTLQIQSESPVRADSFIAEAIGVSRSKVQKAIKNGSILINGEQILVKSQLEGDLTISYDPSYFIVEKDPSAPLPPLSIIFENDDVIVIDKQAGVLVHENDTSTDQTIADSLVAYCPAIAKVGDKPEIRPGIVHRLDKDASGVLIAAKTPEAYTHLKRQFKDRLTKKEYTVLVHGTFERAYGTFNFPISRSKAHGRMAAKPESQGGKEAVTHYTVREEFSHFSLLDVRIETGRTHQIRVHMFASDHPVVGDRLYRRKNVKADALERLFLHASKLTITLPSGETAEFEAPLPDELSNFLTDLPKPL